LGAVLRGLVVPALGGGRTQAMALVALLGTTISPYLFFWQAGQEVEEQHREPPARCACARARCARLCGCVPIRWWAWG
jgi:Mn2+/Fe2+ NRAMP family transporter